MKQASDQARANETYVRKAKDAIPAPAEASSRATVPVRAPRVRIAKIAALARDPKPTTHRLPRAVPADLEGTLDSPKARALVRQTIAAFDEQCAKPTIPPSIESRMAMQVAAPVAEERFESAPPTARQGARLSAALCAAAVRTDAPPAPAAKRRGPPPLPPEQAHVSDVPEPLVSHPNTNPISVEMAVATTLREAVVPSASPNLRDTNVKSAPKTMRSRVAAIAVTIVAACSVFATARAASTGVLIESPAEKAAHGVAAHGDVDVVAATIEATKVAEAASPAPAEDHDLPRVLRHAGAALRRGSTRDAAALYLHATELDPMSAEAWTGLGHIAATAGKNDDAKHDFARALRANPRFLPAALAMADAQWNAGEHEDAAKRYASLVDHYPSSLLPPRVAERAPSQR